MRQGSRSNNEDRYYDLANDHGDLRRAVSSTNKAFLKLLKSHPPSEVNLRHLTIATGRDQDFNGFRQIMRRVGPYLASLHMFVLDDLGRWIWERSSEKMDLDEKTELKGYIGCLICDEEDCECELPSFKQSIPPMIRWDTAFGIFGNAPTFAHLTSLTVTATARVVDHAIGIARFAPNIREMTLRCYWPDEDDLAAQEDDLEGCIGRFENLERLEVYGSEAMVLDAIHGIVPHPPRLTHLVLEYEPEEEPWSEAEDRRNHLSRLAASKSLTSLALYDGARDLFIQSLYELQEEDPSLVVFESLTHLLLETYGSSKERGKLWREGRRDYRVSAALVYRSCGADGSLTCTNWSDSIR